MPGWDVQILDEDENPVAAGERGEICMRARTNPHYPLGYWGRPEESEEVFGGDWFHSKDAASQDGYIWYEGRAQGQRPTEELADQIKAFVRERG